MKKIALTVMSVLTVCLLTACSVPKAPLPTGDQVPVNTITMSQENK